MANLKPKYPAKIDRPIFEKALNRKRLFTLLDDDGSQPLIWISGPAGFGKTTLISTYIQEKNIPCIWYQWDFGDRDPATFYYYLGLACQKETPRARKALPGYAPEFEQDVFSHRFFEALFSRLNPPALIVFDNLVTEPENFFLDILLNVISRIPPGIKIAVVSRSDPPPALSILKVRDHIRTIGTDDLRLNYNEFKLAANLYDLSEVSDQTLMKMHQTGEGWAAGLMLMAESYTRTGVNLDTDPDLNTRAIYNFFAGEIDKELGAGIRDFLYKTSFLPQITIQTAKTLTGYKRSADVLEYLTSHNLFIARWETDPVIYQYHSLFRDYLQKRAASKLTASQLAAIKSKAAKVLRDTGQYEQAAELYADSRIWEDLSTLIIENAPEMVQNGRHHLLEEWLLYIPEEILSGDRNLQFWIGICKLPFSPESSYPYFLRSVELARDAGDAEVSYRSWALAVESVVYAFNDLSGLETLIKMFDDLRATFPEYPSRDIEGTAATGMLTALVFRQLEHPMIDRWARRAVSLALEKGVLSETLLVALIESMRQFYMGNMVDMRVTIETMIEPYDLTNVWISLRPLLLYLRGLKEWTMGNIEACSGMVEKGLETAHDTGVHIWDMVLSGQGAICALTEKNTDLARGYLERMTKLFVRASKHDKSHYHYLAAWASYIDGDFNTARIHAEIAYDLKMELGNPFGIGTNRLALAETLWAKGDRSEAADLLAESRKTAKKCNSGLLLYMCDIAEAWMALGSGETRKAIELIRTAFTYGSAKGIYSFFWFRKNIMSRLCSLAIENGIMVSYVEELIDQHNLLPDSPALDMEDWPWQVKLYTLGRFELVVSGKKVRFTGKSQEKPLSLLMAIVAMGGRSVDSYRLAEALWPDADGAAGQQTLATTLHRLRKLIVIEDAIIFSKNTVTLNPEVFWVDVWAVERTLGQISTVLENGYDDGKELIKQSHMEKIMELYRGHFLSHDGIESWTITPRERLRSKFIRNLTSYCAYLEGQGEDRKAVKWYLKALELENLAEELYQGLIMCYHRLGQQADAISTYNRCRENLSHVLGVEPSAETEAIRERILRST